MSRGLDLHSAILKIAVNHATRDAYWPKAFETWIHGQCYGILLFLLCGKQIFFWCYGSFRFEGNNKYAGKVLSAMEYVDIATLTFAT